MVGPSVQTSVGNLLVAAAQGARADATRAIPTCLKLANLSPPAANRAELGDPFPIIRIGLNSLKNSKKNADLSDFLVDRTHFGRVAIAVSEVLYPVLVDTRMAGSVTLERQGHGTWKPTVFNVGVARALTEARQARLATEHFYNEQYAGISVRALGFYFLGVLGNADLFVPLSSDPETGFEKGVPISAESALVLLSQLAHDHNAQPG
ncbi:MAG: hypothetical protein QOJ84_834 [Bradyrhizobium sp.]|jgi:hypothetical protein|nr:hypothetical protein [Bradyrhizobium sp.]